MPGVTDELMPKDLAPQWLLGDGLYSIGKKSLVMVTKGVRSCSLLTGMVVGN